MVYRKRFYLAIGIALGICLLVFSAPSQARVGVLGSFVRIKRAAPGGIYRGGIRLVNSGEEPRQVKLRQVDYRKSGIRKKYPEPGSLDRSNASWVSLGTTEVNLSPGGRVSIPYTVKVPDDPSLTGSYWSGVMVEPAPGPKPEAEKKKLKIRQAVRYFLLFVTNLRDTGTRKLDIADKKLVLEEEKPYLQAMLKNPGQRMLNPEIWAEVYDSQGKFVGKYQGGKERILPDQSARVRVKLPIHPGEYKLLLIMDNGDKVWGAQYSLDYEE